MNKNSTLRDSYEIVDGLMDVHEKELGYWSPEDLRSLLEHQLRTPLRLEHEALTDQTSRSEREALAFLDQYGAQTFGDVLDGDSEEGLRLVKDFAKGERLSPAGLPKPVAHFLYIATIMRARALGWTSFSSLDPASAESEARRCLTFHWLPDAARDVLRAGLAA